MGGSITAAVLIIIAVDVFIAAALIHTAVQACWMPIVTAFPPREIPPDAIRRDFQSFSAGILNLTWCIHTAATLRIAEHIHNGAHDTRHSLGFPCH